MPLRPFAKKSLSTLDDRLLREASARRYHVAVTVTLRGAGELQP